MAIRKSSNDINSRMFYALRVSEESRVPFLFISAPGMGKSTTVEMFAKIRGYELVMLRGNSITPETCMGFDAVSVDPEATTTQHFRPTWFDQLLKNDANGKKTLLFLDELTTSPQHVQSALLHLVLERRVDNERIPDSTLIVSAGNYSQSLGSTFDLIAPLMNRFCIYNVVPNPSDVHMFLSKYEGAQAGKMIDLIASKTEQLKKLDSKSLNPDPDSRNKIAEYIEIGFRDAVDRLMNSGQKVVDLKVTDLQGIYQDTTSDSSLKGFITPRTLCFLRDATISAYFAFGKEGVTGKNYHLLVEGLCGIGLSRNQSGEVIATEIAKEFESQMKLVVTEIDKMSNDKLPVYNKYFSDVISDNCDKKGNPKFSHEVLTALNSKITEMFGDKDIQGIERPLEAKHIDQLAKGTQAFMTEIAAINIDNKKKVEEYISIEQLTGIISQWNTGAVLLGHLKNLAKESKYGYPSEAIDGLTKTFEKVRKQGYVINIVLKYMTNGKPEVKSLLPEFNVKFAEN